MLLAYKYKAINERDNSLREFEIMYIQIVTPFLIKINDKIQ